jgi:hypothetical protein
MTDRKRIPRVAGQGVLVCALLCAAATPSRAAAVDTTAALKALHEFSQACARDGGALWGRTLCGPIALVDPETRLVVANQPDSAGTWTARGDGWVGTLPAHLGLANTAFELGGTRWAMILLPLSEDAFARAALLLHESFHRIQPGLALWGSGGPCPHLDTRDGRVWLRMELRALAAALRTRDDTSRRAVEDALTFRAWRQHQFPGADTLEARLEIQEGLAEYTGDALAMRYLGAGEDRVADDVARFEKRRSYVRSMAYGTGPALGLLLDRAAPGWRGRITRESKLSGLLAGTAGRVTFPKDSAHVRQRAVRYGLGEVEGQEDAREHERQARAADYRARLVDGPTLMLRASQLGGSFDPNTLFPLGAHGMVYPTGSFMAEWGTLEVDSGGALVGPHWNTVAVPAPTNISARPVRGAGWTLTLADGWTVRERADRPGSHEVARTTQ